MSPSSSGRARRTVNRWMQLVAGIACMVMIANLQYGWTLFVHPINDKYGWGRSAIQVAFTIFVLAETWLVPFEGWFVDRFGPRRVVMLGGVLVGARLVDQPDRRFADRCSISARPRRHRRRLRLRHLRRQRHEVVSRPPRPRDRPHGRGYGAGLGLHHHPHPEHDPGRTAIRRPSCGSASARASSSASPAWRWCAPRGDERLDVVAARPPVGPRLSRRGRCCARRPSGYST